MPLSAKLLVISLCSSAFGNDESVSLLQMHATSRHGHALNDNIAAEWYEGYNQCREKQLLAFSKAISGCRAHSKTYQIDVAIPEGVDMKKLRRSARNDQFKKLKTQAVKNCAATARDDGSDTFDILYTMAKAKGGYPATCKVKTCYGSNLKYKADTKKYETYSLFCGLPLIAENVSSDCNETGFESTHYLQYRPPPLHACDAPLNFAGGMKGNNLNGLGPGLGAKSMRFRNILEVDGEPVDLVVKTTDGYKPANTKKNGRYKKWGASVNLKSGTQSHFNFQFVTSQGQTPVKVRSFMFTVFDFDQSRDCISRTTLNATGYSSYYLSDNTSLRVTTKLPKLLEIKDDKQQSTWHSTPVSTQFQSTRFGNAKDNPKDPLELDEEQAARSVTLVYQNVKSFTIGFGLTGGEKSGRNILFGGTSSITDKVCAMARARVATATTTGPPDQ